MAITLKEAEEYRKRKKQEKAEALNAQGLGESRSRAAQEMPGEWKNRQKKIILEENAPAARSGRAAQEMPADWRAKQRKIFREEAESSAQRQRAAALNEMKKAAVTSTDPLSPNRYKDDYSSALGMPGTNPTANRLVRNYQKDRYVYYNADTKQLNGQLNALKKKEETVGISESEREKLGRLEKQLKDIYASRASGYGSAEAVSKRIKELEDKRIYATLDELDDINGELAALDDPETYLAAAYRGGKGREYFDTLGKIISGKGTAPLGAAHDDYSVYSRFSKSAEKSDLEKSGFVDDIRLKYGSNVAENVIFYLSQDPEKMNSQFGVNLRTSLSDMIDPDDLAKLDSFSGSDDPLAAKVRTYGALAGARDEIRTAEGIWRQIGSPKVSVTESDVGSFADPTDDGTYVYDPAGVFKYISEGRSVKTDHGFEQEFGKLDLMSEEQKAVYLWLAKQYGVKKAYDYIEQLSWELNPKYAQQLGREIADENWFLRTMRGLGSGLNQFAEGISGFGRMITGDDTIRPESVGALTSAQVRSELSGISRVMWDLSTTTGNMAPSILLAALSGGVASGLGAGAQAASTIAHTAGGIGIGAGAAGNAYTQAINEGKSAGEAAAYGLLTGASEAILEVLLGGIEGISSHAAAKKIAGTALGQKAISAIDRVTELLSAHPIAQAIVRRGGSLAGNSLSEFAEEYLQTTLEPVFRNICFDENNELKPFSAEALYDGMLGALSALALGLPAAVGGTVGDASTARNTLRAVGQAADLYTPSSVIGNETAASAARAQLGRVLDYASEEFGEDSYIGKQARAVADSINTGTEINYEALGKVVQAVAEQMVKDGTAPDLQAAYLAFLIGERVSLGRDINGRSETGTSADSEDGQRSASSSPSSSAPFGVDVNVGGESTQIVGVKGEQNKRTFTTADGRSIKPGEIDPKATDSSARVVLTYASVAESAEIGQVAIENYTPGTDAAAYTRGINDIYRAGTREASFDEAVAAAGENASALTRDAQLAAYTAGLHTAADEVKYPTFSQQDVDNNKVALASMKSVYDVPAEKKNKTGKSLSETYKEFFASLGNKIRSKVFGVIRFTKSSIHDEIAHGSTNEKIAAIEAIPAVIENGTVIDQIKKPGGAERIVVAAPIKIGADPYYMGVMLQRDGNGQRLYIHDVVLEKEGRESTKADLNTTGANAEDGHLYLTSILRNALNVKFNLTKSAETNPSPSSTGEGASGKAIPGAEVSEAAEKVDAAADRSDSKKASARAAKLSPEAKYLLERYSDAMGVAVDVVLELPDGAWGKIDLALGRITLSLESASPASTLIHEDVHLIAALASDLYEAMKEVALRYLKESGADVKALIGEKLVAHKKEISGMSTKEQREFATEEIVADAYESILKSKNAPERIAGFLANAGYTDSEVKSLADRVKDIFRKIRDFLKKYLDMLRERLGDDPTVTKAGTYVSQSIDACEHMMNVWEEVHDSFVERRRAGTLENASGKGEKRMAIISGIKDENGNNYGKIVALEYSVFNRLKRNGKAYLNYLRANIFNSKITVYDENGDSETVEFAKSNERVKKDGAKRDHPVIGELTRVKSPLGKLMILNIEETLEISKKAPHFGENNHQWLDKNGWIKRTSYVMTSDGIIHPVDLFIARTADGRNILYSAKIKTEGVAAEKNTLPENIRSQAVFRSTTSSEKNDITSSEKSQEGKKSQNADDLRELGDLKKKLAENKRKVERRDEKIKGLERAVHLLQEAWDVNNYAIPKKENVQSLLRGIINESDSRASVPSLTNELIAAVQQMRHGGTEGAAAALDMLRSVAEKIIDGAERTVKDSKEWNPAYDGFLKKMREGYYSLDESQKGDLAAAYGGLEYFFRRMRGVFRDGVNTHNNFDTSWSEFEEVFPTLKNVDNSIDRAVRTVELADELHQLKNRRYNPLYDRIENLQILPADGGGLEMTREMAVDNIRDKLLSGLVDVGETASISAAERSAFSRARREAKDAISFEVKRRVSEYKSGRAMTEVNKGISDSVRRLVSRKNHPTRDRYVPAPVARVVNDFINEIDRVFGKELERDLSGNAIEKAEAVALGRILRSLYHAFETTYREIFPSSVEEDISDTFFKRDIARIDMYIDEWAGKSFNDLDLAERTELLDMLKSFEGLLASSNEYISGVERLTVAELGERIISEVASLPPKEKMTNRPRAVAGKKLSVKNEKWMWDHVRPADIILYLCGYDESSALYKVLYEDIVEDGADEMHRLMMEGDKIFAPLRNGYINEERFKKFIKKKTETTLPDKKGGKLKLTMAQMAVITALNERIKYNDVMSPLVRTGMTIYDNDSYWKGNRTEAKNKAVRLEPGDFLHNDILKIAEMVKNDPYASRWLAALEKFVDKISGPVIAKYREQAYHVSMNPEKHYCRSMKDGDYISDASSMVKVDQTIDSMGMNKNLVPHAEQPQVILPMPFVIEMMINDSAKLGGLGIPVLNAKRVLNYARNNYITDEDTGEAEYAGRESVKKAMTDRFGEEYNSFIKQLILDLEGSRPRDVPLRKGFKDLIVKNATTNAVTSASVVLKQAASLPTAMITVHPKYMLRAIAQLPHASEKIDEITPEFYRRRGGEAMSAISGQTNVTPVPDKLINEAAGLVAKWLMRRDPDRETAKALDLVGKALRTLILSYSSVRDMDVLTTRLISLAAMEETKDKMGDAAGRKIDGRFVWTEEGRKEAGRAINQALNRTQPMYDPLWRPEILKNKDVDVVSKVVRLFKTQPYQQKAEMWRANQEYRYRYADWQAEPENEAKQKAKNRAARNVLRTAYYLLWTVAVFVSFGALAAKLQNRTKRYRDDDGELTAASVLERLALDFGENSLVLISPLWGGIVGSMIDPVITGQLDVSDSYVSNISTPMLEALTDNVDTVLDLVSSIGDYAALDDGSTDEEKQKELGTLLNRIHSAVLNATHISGIPIESQFRLMNGLLENVGLKSAEDEHKASQYYNLAYKAYLDGDGSLADTYKKRAELNLKKDPDTIDAGIRKLMKDNADENGMQKMLDAFVERDFDAFTEEMEKLIEKFPKKYVEAVLKSMYEDTLPDGEKKEKSDYVNIFKGEYIADAFVNGDIDAIEFISDWYADVDKAFPKSSVTPVMKEIWNDLSDEERERATSLLVEYGGYKQYGPGSIAEWYEDYQKVSESAQDSFNFAIKGEYSAAVKPASAAMKDKYNEYVEKGDDPESAKEKASSTVRKKLTEVFKPAYISGDAKTRQMIRNALSHYTDLDGGKLYGDYSNITKTLEKWLKEGNE